MAGPRVAAALWDVVLYVFLIGLILDTTERTLAEQIGDFKVEKVIIPTIKTSKDGRTDLINKGNVVNKDSDESEINEALLQGRQDLIEGDIIADGLTKQYVNQANPDARNAIAWTHGVWPGGIVPYVIDGSIKAKGVTAINEAIAEYKRLTCIQLIRKRASDRNYLVFRYGSGCSSGVGRSRSERSQNINLHTYCWHKGIVLHEIAHAIGFFHEQSRTDRDSYIRVVFSNIRSGREHNFRKHGTGVIQNLGEPYDYSSIMHYGKKAFSKNGQTTILTLRPGGDKIGQRKVLSANDIRQINKLYKCSSKPVNPGPNPGSTVYCNFDNRNTCKFAQVTDGTDQFDWSIKKGPTPSQGTGPKTDFSGSGYYVYTEASEPQQLGNTARLMSPRLTGTYCVRFHFHMVGNGMGTLNVYQAGRTERKIFTYTGSRENVWFSAQATVRDVKTYQIVFEGVVGHNFRGDIALDEIKLSHGVCPGAPPPPPPPTSRPRPTSGKCGARFLSGSSFNAGSSRVVAGRPATPNSWPWQIEMVENSKGHYCGGSLVSDRWVVTAAHCVQGKRASDFTIVMGEHDRVQPSSKEQKRNVRRIIMHPRYSSLNNDIALLELDRPVTLNRWVNVICLPPQGYTVPTGTMCHITGWGRLGASRPSSRVLQEASMPIVDHAICKRHMSAVSSRMITRQMVCGGFGGSSPISGCFGDSGGPFVCQDPSTTRWVLQGAVSWGSRTCSAGFNQYTVYARVSEFTNWIQSHTGVTVLPPRPVTHRPPRPVTHAPPRPVTHAPPPGGSCPVGWSSYLRSCYIFVQAKTSWVLASSDCQRKGGRLASPNTKQELDYLYRYTIRASPVYIQFIWGGARRDRPYGKFSHWVDGTRLTYNMWLGKEPNNYWGNEDCMEMMKHNGKFRWFDTPCSGRRSKKQAYVCERAKGSVRPRPPTPRPRPPTSSCGIKGYDRSVPVRSDGRIVGGQDATPGEWPWQAALMCKGCSRANCGGSLVSPYHVVTAAHCVNRNTPKFFKIRLGEHNFQVQDSHQQDINIASVSIHPSYGSKMDYDVAVLKLASPARLTTRVKPVCLNSANSAFPTGTKCYITGWGRLAINRPGSLILKEAVVPLVSDATCKKSYGSHRITPRMLCAGFSGGGIDTCKGDSGGPLVCVKNGRWQLTGITSWGKGCAQPKHYGVYTNVAQVYSWIRANMN